MEMTWTPERVEMLNHLFEEGLPTSEIGRRRNGIEDHPGGRAATGSPAR